MVDDLAPGREHLPRRWSADLSRVPVAAVCYGSRVHAPVLHAADRPHANGSAGAPRPCADVGGQQLMALFFDMGKYAAFAWPAYGVSVLGIVSAIVLTMRAYRRAKARLQSFEQSAK